MNSIFEEKPFDIQEIRSYAIKLQEEWKKVSVFTHEELITYSEEHVLDPNFYFLANRIQLQPYLDSEILRIWIQKGDKNLRKVVCSFTTDPEILDTCADDTDFEVRRYVALNSNTDVKTLCFLARDKVESVRAAVASNPNTPEYYLRYLGKDTSLMVLERLASNPKTSGTILDDILKLTDIKLYVKKASKFREFTFDEKQTLRFIQKIEENAILNPKLSLKTMTTYAKSRIKAKRLLVAQNHRLPRELFDKLSRDKSKDVVIAIARNHSTPVEVLSSIYQKNSKNNDILIALVLNSKTPKDVLMCIYEQVKEIVNHNANNLKAWMEEIWIINRIVCHPNIKFKTAYSICKYLNSLSFPKTDFYLSIAKTMNRYFADIYTEIVLNDKRATLFLINNPVAVSNWTILVEILRRYEDSLGFEVSFEMAMHHYSKKVLEAVVELSKKESIINMAKFLLKAKFESQ